nr:aminopeptidase RNPEPL1 [Vulpes vulpes]
MALGKPRLHPAREPSPQDPEVPGPSWSAPDLGSPRHCSFANPCPAPPVQCALRPGLPRPSWSDPDLQSPAPSSFATAPRALRPAPAWESTGVWGLWSVGKEPPGCGAHHACDLGMSRCPWPAAVDSTDPGQGTIQFAPGTTGLGPLLRPCSLQETCAASRKQGTGGRGSWRPHVPLSVPRRGEGPRPRCDGDGQARPPALAADRPCPPPPQIWWLDPELTYGNAKPFVFTQGHSVCNRSFFPCFDTPAVKCTYSAVVKAPSGVQVLMSATQSSYVEEEGVYRFHMEHPVPAYLVALVAGDLQPADIGPRSRVWAEPCLLPTATSKLAGAVEQWLSAAERLYGPYMWGRYDIVFLPPSFPIVAMENPCLTFIISSILESDEFLVIDVIHEVAHSWFGNAVTNATWEEMWLSEGLATYAQRRITTETYGAAFTCLETAFRLDALHRQMKLLGEDSPVSKLQVKLEPGVNPSHLMNLFTYEKGYCFVYYLSQLCGDPQRFDDFLRAYVEKYKFTSVVAQDLLDSFLSFFPELKEQSVDCRAGLEFERWLNATGPPLAEPDLSQGSSLTRPVEALFQLWTAEPLDQAAASASAIDISKWRTFQTALFLDRLLDGSPLPQEVVMSLSKCYSSLLDSMNAEIRIRWLQIVVRNDYYPDLHRVRRFLESQMSRMYTIPLYEDLCTGALKSFALEVFYQTQGRLHPNLRRTIQQILSQGLGPGAEPSAEQASATADSGVDADAPALLLGDEAPSSAISLRDVNVSA